MRITPAGPYAPSFAAVQAQIEGMLIDNGTLTASNAVAANGAITSGAIRYLQMIEITSEPDALGRIPPRAGQFLLIPRLSGSTYLQFYDSATGTTTTSALAIPGSTANSAFSCGVTLPNGVIQLVPWSQTVFAHYDPWSDTVTAGPTHGRTSTSTVPAFAGAAVGTDGKVYYSPGHPSDKAISHYNYATNTFTVTAHVLPYNSDWQTSINGGSVIPLPDGDMLFLTQRNVVLAAPWRYKPSTGAVTNATLTSSTTSSVMVGGCLDKEGKHVWLAETQGSKLRAYRLADNTLLDAYNFGANIEANPWSGITMLPDGRLCLIGNGHLGFGLIDTAAFALTLGTVAATGVLTATANFTAGETVVIAGKTYTFQTSYANTNGLVVIGASLTASLANLAAAVSLGAGGGTVYGSLMSVNTAITYGGAVSDATTMTITARDKGSGGNAVTTTETAANASWGGATLSGGINIGSFAGITGATLTGSNNTYGGKMTSGTKMVVVPGSALSNFFTFEPFTMGSVPEGVRKSRFLDIK